MSIGINSSTYSNAVKKYSANKPNNTAPSKNATAAPQEQVNKPLNFDLFESLTANPTKLTGSSHDNPQVRAEWKKMVENFTMPPEFGNMKMHFVDPLAHRISYDEIIAMVFNEGGNFKGGVSFVKFDLINNKWFDVGGGELQPMATREFVPFQNTMPSNCFSLDVRPIPNPDRTNVAIEEEMVNALKNYFSGRIDKDELNAAFNKAVNDIKDWLFQTCKTSGINAEHNTQILFDVYEKFRDQIMNAAMQINHAEGAALAETFGDFDNDNFVYYNSKLAKMADSLRSEVKDWAEKIAKEWGLDVDFNSRSQIKMLNVFETFNETWSFQMSQNIWLAEMTDFSKNSQDDFIFFYREHYGDAFLYASDGVNSKQVNFSFTQERADQQRATIFDYFGKNSGFSDSVLDNFKNISLFTKWYSTWKYSSTVLSRH